MRPGRGVVGIRGGGVGRAQAGKPETVKEPRARSWRRPGPWALARFCAPWVPNAGEKGKNALSRERKAFGMSSFGTRGWSWPPAKAFFSFSPGNCLRCKKRAKAHTSRRAAITGFLIDVPQDDVGRVVGARLHPPGWPERTRWTGWTRCGLRVLLVLGYQLWGSADPGAEAVEEVVGCGGDGSAPGGVADVEGACGGVNLVGVAVRAVLAD